MRESIIAESTIVVEELKKSFTVSHSGAGSLKTALLWWKKRRIEKLDVLKGINLEVSNGEFVALVGKNGAGKSTLLSLLSRIYKPTFGIAKVNGRLAPLLELGAGFHPDLSGRDNVIFNAMILGLTRAEAQERLQQIIDFSGVAHMIDAPIRTYSSGMLARLGFSVAVHVDATVLIVDEVLAVGDKEFERKCYDRLTQFQDGGGTILFVSHDLEMVRRVASRVVWLEYGLVKQDGPTEEVIAAYLASYPDP